MTSWIALSPTDHTDTRWLPRKDFANASSMQVIELFGSEINSAPTQYPLGFVKLNDEYQLIALVGLEKDRNLYVDLKGRWLAEYVPASLRCYPFILADHEKKEGESVVCIDQDHLTDDVAASRLFTDDGEQDESLTEVTNFLIRCNQDRAVTREACSALAKAGVIEDWPLNVQKPGDEGEISIEGLYRINEAKLNTLEPLDFAGLRESGAFSMAYAQLFSMPQLILLIRRHEFLARQQQQRDNNEELDNFF